MQAAATKNSSFRCPKFSVPSKSKDTTDESKAEKESIEQSSASEEDKIHTEKEDAGGDAKPDNVAIQGASGDAKPDEVYKQETEEQKSDVVKDDKKDTVKAVSPSGDAKPNEVQKKVVKKKPAFSVKQKEGESKETGEDKEKKIKKTPETKTESKDQKVVDNPDKPKKEKKPKTLKEPKEKKHKEPKEPKVSKEKKEKPARVPKEKKEKAPKPAPLPVRSLTDEEYEAIFTAAIETVMAINMDEWQPRETTPVVVKKKKYSITVGRKPDPKKKVTTQSSLESIKEEENTANEEDIVAEKECNDNHGETGKDTTEVHDTLDSDNGDEDDDNDDVKDDVAGPGGNVEEDADDRIEVDENNNDIAVEYEHEAEQDHGSIDMVQHQNETTPEGSEVDYGTTPAPVAAPAPACVSPPAKKKRIAGIGKKKKLEPKSLSFSEKAQKVLESNKPSKDSTTEKSETVGKVEKKDVLSVEMKKKTQEKSSTKKEKQKEIPIKEQIRKLKQMVKELEQETKEPNTKRKADIDEHRKDTKPKEEKKKVENKKKELEKEVKPVKKQSKKVWMQKRKVGNEGTWVQCCNSTCLKWRHLPDISDPSEVPERWVCKMNTRKEYNSCDKPEEKYDESEHIYTKFTEGSLVWAKISGWPWWPAMVEMDPDAETFFDTTDDQSMVPTHYHVVFFDDKVSRAWVKTDLVKLFTGSEEADNIKIVQPVKKGASYTKEINHAKKNAMEALQYSLQERIELFGFATRYHGKWGNSDIYDFDDTKKTSKPEKKRKVTCREDKKKQPKQSSTTTYLLDDDDIESILDNTESLLDNVEEVLDSLDSQLDDPDEDSDFGHDEVIPKKKRKFETSEPEVTAKSVKKSKAPQLDSDSENECETDMVVDETKTESDNKKENFPKPLTITSDKKKKAKGDKSSKGKIDEKVTQKTGGESQSKDDTNALKNETETEPQIKDVTERHETKDKIKFDPEIFTMEVDNDSQTDNMQKSQEDVEPKTEKATKKSKGKSKEFKAPANKKEIKKVKGTAHEDQTTKREPDCDKKAEKGNISVECKVDEIDKKEDTKSNDINEENDTSKIADDRERFDQKDSEQDGQNQADKTSESDNNEKNKKGDDESDDELDLAPEVPDIDSQDETCKKEQAQAKVSNEDSDDDFDLIEKSMYDNDPVLDKVHEMEVVNVTVYHGQDSDSDPFDMMMEE